MRVDFSAFYEDCFKTDYFSENGCRVSIYGKNILMGASSGLEFLALFVMMDRIGLIISCVQVRAREMGVLLERGIGGFNLAVVTEELMFRGV